MKIIISIIALISSLPLIGLCQEQKRITYEMTVSLGNSILTNKLPGTDQQLSPCGQINGSLNIPIRKQVFIKTGLGYESNRHLVDGIFVKNLDQFGYQQAPSNFTQNEILLDYINMPILFKKNFSKAAYQDFNIGIGPVLSYLVYSKQKAKINGTTVLSDAPVENKFRYGVNLDFDLKRNWGNKVAGIVGWGLYYQLSKNLETSKSFIPLTAYLKFGFGN